MTETADQTLARILAGCRDMTHIVKAAEIKAGRTYLVIKPPQPGWTHGSYYHVREIPWPRQGEY